MKDLCELPLALCWSIHSEGPCSNYRQFTRDFSRVNHLFINKHFIGAASPQMVVGAPSVGLVMHRTLVGSKVWMEMLIESPLMFIVIWNGGDTGMGQRANTGGLFCCVSCLLRGVGGCYGMQSKVTISSTRGTFQGIYSMHCT